MRTLLAFLLALPVVALDNSVRIVERTGAAQASRPFTLFRSFANDEICGYPQPFADGAAITPWQSDVWSRWPASALCPAGAVKTSYISFRLSLAADQTIVVDFRENANPCSSGDQNACAAAALTQSSMLSFNGGNWGAKMTVTASPQGTSSVQNVDARAMMSAGVWSYRLRGPVVTQVVVEDRTTARSYDIGWRESWTVRPTETIYESTRTTINVEDASNWLSLSRPFKVVMDSEILSICYVTATTLIVGTTNGTSAACASIAGRGVDGTTPTYHPANFYQFIRLHSESRLAADLDTYATSFTLTDASAITVPTVLQVAGEQIRVCAKSGNTLTVGTGAAGCAAAGGGRSWGGANTAYGRPANTPIFDLAVRTDRWIDATSSRFKSLHPVFVVTFFTGFTGVGIEYHMFNQWTDRLQDQEYDVSFYRGSAGTTAVASKTAVRHVAWSNWKYPDGPEVGLFTGTTADRKIWDGTTPGAVRLDYNLPYLRYAGVVPYDPTVTINQGALDDVLVNTLGHSSGQNPAWNVGSKCAIETVSLINSSRGNSGPIHRGWADPGGRADLGLNPFWFVVGLYSMNSSLPSAERWPEWVFGTGSCAGYSVIHLWQGTTSANFCASAESAACPTCKSCTGSNLTASAFGRPISIDARPGITYLNDQANNEDAVGPVGQRTYNLWGTGDGTSHFPELAFVPYLLSGDWYYEQNLATIGSWVLMTAAPYPGYNPGEFTAYYQQYMRHGSWGWFANYNGTRPVAWALRSLSNAAWAMKQGSPEREFFTKKIEIHAAVNEGKYNITNGYYYEPCPGTCADDYSYWQWGRRRQGYATENISKTIMIGTVGGYIPWDLSPDTYVDKQFAFNARSLWMDNYYYSALGDAENKGFWQLRPMRTFHHRVMLNWLRNPAMNPFTVGEYRVPGLPCMPEGVSRPNGCGEQAWTSIGQEFAFSSFDYIAQAFTSTAKNRNGFVNDHDMIGGYARISNATAAFLPDGVAQDNMRGTAAWDWMKGNVKFHNLAASNPMWVLSPKVEIRNLSIQVGDTTTAITASSNTSDPCKIGISAGPFASTSDAFDADAQMEGKQIHHLVTGLLPSTLYHYRISCGPAGRTGRVRGTFTTPATGGAATTIPLSLTAPPNRGVANVLVEYGATSALGSSATAACASNCDIAIPALVNRQTYYRVTFRDGANGTVARGRILATVGVPQ
jgi:hypothetical protein